MKYEVDHPRSMFGNDLALEAREKELNRAFMIEKALMLAGLGCLVFALIKVRKRPI